MKPIAFESVHTILAVSHLSLDDFRCFSRAVLTVDSRPVVLTGSNGSGKTTILEALSLLTPGAGIRGARLADFPRNGADTVSRWGINARIKSTLGPVQISTGQGASGSDDRRQVKIDGRVIRGQAALAEVVCALWLTPAMDRLFLDGAFARRRFLDRLVLGCESGHATQLATYQRALRQRAALLRERRVEPDWLQTLEGTMAKSGIAVAAARRATVKRLAQVFDERIDPFPGARLSLTGKIESWLDDMPAIDAELRFSEALAASRQEDIHAGTTALGPHRTDLVVEHGSLDRPAAQCSTGEQKALLIAIVIAAARARKKEWGAAPLLLLDEVAAHLDAQQRCALFDLICASGIQAWMTGTDTATFESFGERAQFLASGNGSVVAH